MKQDKNERLNCIYQKMYPIMYRVACRLSGSVETAENLTHDAFSLALSRQDVFFTHPNPEGWLMVTLTHLIKNERKKRSSTELPLETLSLHIPATEESPTIRDLLPSDLPEKDKQLLIWWFEDRLSHREIGVRLGVSEDVSRARLSRAVQKCKRLLNDREFHS